MYLDSTLVRLENYEPYITEIGYSIGAHSTFIKFGAHGNPMKARKEYGKKGLELKIEAALYQVKAALN